MLPLGGGVGAGPITYGLDMAVGVWSVGGARGMSSVSSTGSSSLRETKGEREK